MRELRERSIGPCLRVSLDLQEGALNALGGMPRKLLANGIDPGVQRRLDKIAAAAGGNTSREVADQP
jgi:hypothetical protein